MGDNERGDSAGPAAWERHAAACRSQISELGWLVGRWRGRGESSEGTRVSEVETRPLFDGTFLESRERAYSADGVLRHEDLTVYGVTPDPGGRGGEVWARLYMVGGLTTDYEVNVFGESVLCEPKGMGARLSIVRDKDGYRVTVFFPGERNTWVQDATLFYERTE